MTPTTHEATVAIEEVRRIAHLARLALGEEELLATMADMQHILQHIHILSGLDVTDVVPGAHATPLESCSRGDVVQPGLSLEKVLANAPERLGDGFGVPKIIE